MEQQPIVSHDLLIVEVTRSHSDISHSLRFLWTSDQPDAETCTYTTNSTYKRQTSMP